MTTATNAHDQSLRSQDLSGNLRPQVRLTQFDGSREHVHQGHALSRVGESHVVASFAGAEWDISGEIVPAPDRPDAVDGRFSFRVTKGAAPSVAVALEWSVTPWSRDNFVLLPAAAYNGNRYTARTNMRYPPMLTVEDIGLKPATMITDVPRLELDNERRSHLQLLTGDEATPSLSFYSPSGNYACIVLTDQGSVHGGKWFNHGLHVIEEIGHRSATLRIESPGVRSRRYGMMNAQLESDDRGVDLAPGEEIIVRFRLFRFAAASVQDLYDRFAEVRKDLTGPVRLQHGLPFSAAWKILEAKYNEQNWNPAGYYAVDVRERFSGSALSARYADWQLGWVGGGISSYPLLFQGEAVSRWRALRTIAWMFEQGQLPSGLFAPIFHRGKVYSDHSDDPEGIPWAMVRKEADALYFLMKHFALLEKQNPDWMLPEAWGQGTRRLCDLFVSTFRKHGQLGQYLDMNTGDIVVGGSTAAAMLPGGLALAGIRFGGRCYLETAKALAVSLFDRDVRSGVTTGGPGDILQCPDSESAFAMLESLVVLFEVTGDRAWLPMAEAMAKQCLTWCASYDYRFPPESCFGGLDVRAAGSVWANVQNKHSAPGICTLSGDSLFKLWRATGNLLYLDVIQEMAHNLSQYLCRVDRQVGDPAIMKPGYMCERVNFSDWEGRGNIGGNLFGSCWSEVSLALTTVEIPGLYVQPDTGFFRVFDHIDVSMIQRDESGIGLRLSNPTAFAASVRVLAESASSTVAHPLGQAALFGAPVLEIPAGDMLEVWIGTDGSIKA